MMITRSVCRVFHKHLRCVMLACLAVPAIVVADEPDSDELSTGRYLVTIAGCNDCHTAGWAETNGNVPENDWLTGLPIGWRGPWGTTYASNLRLLAADMAEDGWIEMMKTRKDRPPMPWMNVNQMTDADSRAMYRYIRSLGAAGDRMPLATGPDVEPETAYFLFQPIEPQRNNAVSANDRTPE